MTGEAVSDCLRFGAFVLDRADERLTGPDGPVHIGNKAFQLLRTLADAAGRLVTKDEIFSTVWDGTIVSESALTSVVKELRIALGDDSRSPRFIESIYGRGYRFIAPVAHEQRPAAGQVASLAPNIAICVLPFVNISGEAKQDYFSDGITEDITTDLSKIAALRVLARNTAFQFKGHAIDVVETARKLRVTHVLEGSVRKSGNRVRVTAQLIDGRSGGHIWAERFDRDLTDIFAIQDEISGAIVQALQLKLLPEEKAAIRQRGTSSAEAYDLYLMARQTWVSGNHGDHRREERVIRICQRAIVLDPQYAAAMALMAIAQASLRYRVGSGDLNDGVDAAERALAIDPTLAEAHCPIARRHDELGQTEEAERVISRAIGLDGDSWEVNKEAGRFFFRHRRIAEAARHFEKAASVMEHDYHAWSMLYSCYRTIGDRDASLRCAAEVLKQAERALEQDSFNGTALSLGGSALVVLGNPERGRQWIERALVVDPDNVTMRYNFACTLAGTFKDIDGAIDVLLPAMEKFGAATVKLARTDPDLDALRDDARFEDMLSTAEKRLHIV